MKRKGQNRTIDDAQGLAYEHPVYLKPDEDKENPHLLKETIKYLKARGIPVDRISLPGRSPQYYAIWNAETEDEAREANRRLDKDEKEFFRHVLPMIRLETSLDALREKGYDPDNTDASVDAGRRNRSMTEQDDRKMCVNRAERFVSEEFRNPENIYIEKTMLKELAKALEEITDEQREICSGVAEKVTDRAMAEKMGMAKSTYQNRKAKTLKEMNKKLKGYKSE